MNERTQCTTGCMEPFVTITCLGRNACLVQLLWSTHHVLEVPYLVTGRMALPNSVQKLRADWCSAWHTHPCGDTKTNNTTLRGHIKSNSS